MTTYLIRVVDINHYVCFINPQAISSIAPSTRFYYNRREEIPREMIEGYWIVKMQSGESFCLSPYYIACLGIEGLLPENEKEKTQ